MAFFGLTLLGYQEPFRERKLELEKPDSTGPKPLKGGLFHPKLPPIGPRRLNSTLHQGSYNSYCEAIKKNQLKKSPNQVFRVPVTCAQDSGWWLPRDPAVPAEEAIPWMTVARHPLISSPMTRFVDSMGLSSPLFSLF
ncbi:sperm microtubule inner protein 11 [Emydura macquarii macquarii]|uniref:sperm microtubule inner protein 11 n=1 Tax=Emydura macquarii macquarii TaxID=1129001 RepID=UPI003529DCFD